MVDAGAVSDLNVIETLLYGFFFYIYINVCTKCTFGTHSLLLEFWSNNFRWCCMENRLQNYKLSKILMHIINSIFLLAFGDASCSCACVHVAFTVEFWFCFLQICPHFLSRFSKTNHLSIQSIVEHVSVCVYLCVPETFEDIRLKCVCVWSIQLNHSIRIIRIPWFYYICFIPTQTHLLFLSFSLNLTHTPFSVHVA